MLGERQRVGGGRQMKGASALAPENPENDGQFLLNDRALRTQYGALCWRRHRGRTRVLLVTSRDTGRWIIPKGWPIAGLSPEAAALQEAWEEAGVRGQASPMCLGLYRYDKVLTPDRRLPCLVAVYPVQVAALRDRFPERRERRRAWFSPEKAAERVEEAALGDLIAGFSRDDAAGT